MATVHSIEEYLGVDTDSFTPSMAEALLQFNVNDQAQQRAAVLAEKTNFGTITEAEHAEYLRIIELDEILSIMQAKARGLFPPQS